MTDPVGAPERKPDPGREGGSGEWLQSSRAEGADSEAELMHRIADGDLASLELLYDRYRGLAYALALRVTGDVGLAEDVVQDSFVGVWRNAGRYAEARGSVRGWLLAVVRHRSIDVLRRRKNDTTLEESEEPIATPAVLTLPDIWPEVAGRLDAETVRLALGNLPAPQRQSLELAYFEGLTQREISDKVGVPLGTVKSRMRLGLLALRRDLIRTLGDDRAVAVDETNRAHAPGQMTLPGQEGGA